jgi:hypothetical protein
MSARQTSGAKADGNGALGEHTPGPLVRCGLCRFWRTRPSFDAGWGNCDRKDFFMYHAAALNESHKDTACPLGELLTPKNSMTGAE